MTGIDMMKQFVSRLIAAIALTLLISASAGISYDLANVGKLFLMLAMPCLGLLVIRHLSLTLRMIFAGVTGLIVGALFGHASALLLPVGALLIRVMTMLVVPLVFASVVVSSANIGDWGKLARIGGKTLGWYLLTVALAMAIGLAAGTIFQPGAGLTFEPAATQAVPNIPILRDTLLQIVPENLLAALAAGKLLPLMAFAILLGVSIAGVGVRAQALLRWFEAAADVMLKMTKLVLAFAPYGVYALSAVAVGQHGLSVMMPLAQMLLLVYGACLLHAGLVYGTLLTMKTPLRPRQFFQGLTEAMLVAFTTGDDVASLPATMRCVQEKLGVSREFVSLSLPFGAMLNRDGAAIYQGICVMFITQLYGISLSLEQYVVIVFSSVILSVSAAGMPEVGIIILSFLLHEYIGVPTAGLVLLVGLDRLFAMARTWLNVTGNACVCAIVAQSEGELLLPALRRR